MRPTTRRHLMLASAVALAGTAACQPELNAPVRQIGEPLLNVRLGFASAAVYPGGSVRVNADRDTAIVTLTNLAPLPAGMMYQVLLSEDFEVVDTTDTTFEAVLYPASGTITTTTRTPRPVNRDLTVIEEDVTTEATDGTIAEADTNQTFVLRLTVDDPGVSVAELSGAVVVVTPSRITAPIQLSDDERRGFLYGRYRTGAKFSTGKLTFGSFAADPGARLPFSQSGTFDAAFWGSQIRANFRNLIRPPEGFQYAAWLIDDRTGTVRRVGVLETPFPEFRSLANADVETSGSRGAIVEAHLRASADTLGIVFDDFTRLVLLLEPKGGTAPPERPSGALVLTGDVPPAVAGRHPGAGKIFGQVTSNSGSEVAGTTLFLTPATSQTPLQVTNADSTGAFRFRTVNVGSYQLRAIPPGGTQVVTSIPVTVGVAAGGNVGDSLFVNVQIP